MQPLKKFRDVIFIVLPLLCFSCSIVPIKEKDHPKYLSNIKTICLAIETNIPTGPSSFLHTHEMELLNSIERKIKKEAYTDVEAIIRSNGFNVVKVEDKNGSNLKRCDASLEIRIYGGPGTDADVGVPHYTPLGGGIVLITQRIVYYYVGFILMYPAISFRSKGRLIFFDGNLEDKRHYRDYGHIYRLLTGSRIESKSPIDNYAYETLYKSEIKKIEQHLLDRISIIKTYNIYQ